jgi:EmrB/QacA subfamily drug resistance transporter
MPQVSPHRPLVLAAVMSAMFMIAIEATIIATAMPQIAARLGDLHLYSWVFSSFLLTQTATTIVFGKLADMYGRKPVLLVGTAIFLVGSALCGFAGSMPELILYRLIQGFGAGAIQPIALTIVGDLYPGAQRARVQGYLSSVWGISSVLGPLAGGLITQHLGWAWVFWINIPVGLIAIYLFGRYLPEKVVRTERRVDWAGALLFTAATAALMLALTELGGATDVAVGAAVVFLLCGALFIWQERRAADPMVAFGLWLRRPIATANGAMLLAGMALIGLTAFLPMYVQGVMGRSALVAGFTLTAMTLGWPLGAILAARVFFLRLGLRGTMVLGGMLPPLGAGMMLFLTTETSPFVAGAGSLIMGLGMGLLSTASIVLIQSTVGWAERGAATASNVFARMLGSTFGATVMGGVLNASLAHHPVPVAYDQVRRLLEAPGQAVSDPVVQDALRQGLHLTFWAMFLITLSAFAAASLVPRVALRQPAE